MLLKILHLLSNRWNSAITEYALSAAHSLKLRGGEQIFCPIIGSPAERRLTGQGLVTSSLPSFGLKHLGKLSKILRHHNPQVVICYGGPELSLISLLRASGLWQGKIVRFRGQNIEEKGVFSRFKYRISHRFVSKVVVPSLKMQQKHRALAPHISCERVILGCPTHTYRFVGEVAKNHAPSMVLLGRLDPVKGHDQALAIFTELVKGWKASQGPHPILHIIGEPANLSREDISRLIAKHNLIEGKHVLLTTERIADIPACLSGADLGLISSLDSEVICRVAEEFLLCGTPVLVSGVGSLEEVLIEGSFGKSYKGMDHHAAAGLLERLVIQSHHEDVAAKINRSQLAQRLFSWETMGLQLEQSIR